MQKRIGRLWVVGIFGFSAAAIAQTLPSSTVGTRFDGTYAFVSSSKVNETYTSHITEHLQRCLDRSPPRPLVIVNGHARLFRYGGTVGAQGELLMQRDPEPWGRGAGSSVGVEVIISGRIDNDGTVRARQTGYYCSYDLIWRKMPK
jgi:hypothetical protein